MNTYSKNDIDKNREYLELLSEKYKNTQQARAKIIDLTASLYLPKGTEHFITDIHGEHEAFEHVLRNCSGSIKRKVSETLDGIAGISEINELSTLIYYPRQKLALIKEEKKLADDSPWYKKTINYLIMLCRNVSSKYTREKVRQAMNPNFVNIMEELLNQSDVTGKRELYYENVINTIVDTKASCDFIIELCNTIRKLNLDHLHIIGDIYDRGRGAHHVMDIISNYHSVDIQWGNHDILWMGAGFGEEACIANAMRISLRYGNLSTLKDGYGIDLLPLTFFAQKIYKDSSVDELKNFMPKISDESPDIDYVLLAKMHKAITIIQFKLESAIIKNHPEYKMDERNMLDKCDFDNFTITLDGKTYKLNSKEFPTINKNNPTRLTNEEKKVLKGLKSSFLSSEKLRQHINTLMLKGSIYLVYNKNLLFHGSIPLNSDGTFKEIMVDGKAYTGSALLDAMEIKLRALMTSDENDKSYFFYMWCAPDSPLFGKTKMATFERYFINDKASWSEEYLYYYKLSNNEDIADYILAEFGLHDENSHIINGHVPIKLKDGQSPIQAGGKLLLIDGGYAKSYQSVTGVAGCTLTFNSYGLNLITHEPFESIENAISKGIDIKSEHRFISTSKHRILNGNTDMASGIKKEIHYLEMLLSAYLSGEIKVKE